MANTLDFESNNPSSNLGRTCIIFYFIKPSKYNDIRPFLFQINGVVSSVSNFPQPLLYSWENDIWYVKCSKFHEAFVSTILARKD